MYGYIYLTTNMINKMKYIGKHEALVWDTKYKGSGTILKRAFKKYGKENFECSLLCECYSAEDLNAKEQYYINEYDAVNSKEFYNIALGGSGGNTTAGYTDEQRKLKGERISKALKNKPKSEQHKQNISTTRKQNGKSAGENNSMYGIHRCGKDAPTYGFHWYNNGVDEIFVKEDIYLSTYKSQNYVKGLISNHKYKNK